MKVPSIITFFRNDGFFKATSVIPTERWRRGITSRLVGHAENWNKYPCRYVISQSFLPRNYKWNRSILIHLKIGATGQFKAFQFKIGDGRQQMIEYVGHDIFIIGPTFVTTKGIYFNGQPL